MQKQFLIVIAIGLKIWFYEFDKVEGTTPLSSQYQAKMSDTESVSSATSSPNLVEMLGEVRDYHKKMDSILKEAEKMSKKVKVKKSAVPKLPSTFTVKV